MAIFGVRPGEVPSLVLSADGFANCLTTKLKRALPSTRDVMALPKSWVEELNLQQVSIPGNNRWTKPEDYNSDTARLFLTNWNQWWSRQPTHLEQARALLPDYQNYDLRYAWALIDITNRDKSLAVLGPVIRNRFCIEGKLLEKRSLFVGDVHVCFEIT